MLILMMPVAACLSGLTVQRMVGVPQEPLARGHLRDQLPSDGPLPALLCRCEAVDARAARLVRGDGLQDGPAGGSRREVRASLGFPLRL